MKVQAKLIRHYLGMLTAGRAASMPEPMSSLRNFDGDIDDMKVHAAAEGDLDWLRLALNALANGPPERIRPFAGTLYPFTAAELAAIVQHARARIWPGEEHPAPGTEAAVEFAEIPDADWALLRRPDLGF